jgi:hypothetical protein
VIAWFAGVLGFTSVQDTAFDIDRCRGASQNGPEFGRLAAKRTHLLHRPGESP